MRCPAPATGQQEGLARLAAYASKMEHEYAALHTLALVDLVTHDPRGKALDRAISNLRRAAEIAAPPAPVLADLAAALVIRAEHTQAPRDLLEAYETAEQALRREPRNLAALYNRALALDRLGLVDEAARDWQAYLAVDSISPWADEAGRRRRAALAMRLPSPPPDTISRLPAYLEYAAADPQGARELGMSHLLAEWGDAVEAGDAAAAGDRLRRAAVLGEGLERRPGGDASLADAVRAIRAASGSEGATRALARLHREYAAGQRAFTELDFAGAEPRFAEVAAADASPALRGWARVYLGATWLQLRKTAAAERLLAQAAEQAPARHPALAARAHWPLGRSLARAERWETALEHARQAARQFDQAGERENEGAALGILADIRFVLGDPDSGYAALHRAADRLKRHRASARLHNVLVAAANAAAADGFIRSAIQLQGEGVGVATRTGEAALGAEARLERARHLAAGGEPARAAVDLETAGALVRTLRYENERAWFAAHLREVEAYVSLQADPARRTRSLDSAAAFFAEIPLPFRALPALVGSAEVRLAAGDAAGAIQRLETAIGLLEQRRDSIRMEPRRAAVFDAARAVVDRIVLLELAQDRVREALGYMDRGRASLATVGLTEDSRAGVAAPPGETVLVYARIADTLLAWTVAASRVQVSTTVLDTVRFTRTLRDVEARLERGASAAELRPALSLLYDWIIRPAKGLPVDPERPLVVIADGEIAAVPFAALYDATRRRHFVEDHPLRFAVSLVEARRGPAPSTGGGMLLIADPAFDGREHPLLERLAHAGREVGTIRSTYPGAVVLDGARATRPAVESALARAGVVHFAGHAVFDDQRPERSYLVLAPAAGPGRDGKLTAAELAQLDLRRVRLVVLSACRTVRSGRGRAGGFSGLSGALLAAGAGGTVASTWDVDDHLTAVLMTQFHHAYQAHGNGPRALREAQLALLRSGDPILRGPAAWAGFRYAGR